MNLVELLSNNNQQSPCVHGNISDSHACYCHHPSGPRKCPIWRNYGIADLARWHPDGDFAAPNWDGGCRLFQRHVPEG